MRVGVIGAGLAGLTCASALAAANIQVRVFDKARGAGGRLATKRTATWQADLGAQYFTARDAEFREAVALWEAAGVAAPWPAELVSLDDRAPRPVDDGTTRWVGMPRMSAITRYLASGLQVATEQRISRIDNRRDGWWLQTHAAATHGPFTTIVVALPAPQAGALLASAAPALAADAAVVPMQGCWAAALELDASTIGFDAAFVRNHPLRWIAREASKPGRKRSSLWVAHAAAEWSEARIEQSSAKTLPALQALFQDATGTSASVKGLLAHKWRYSQSPVASAAGYLIDAEHGVGACGDWCHGNRVEGAWLSGRRLAARLLGD